MGNKRHTPGSAAPQRPPLAPRSRAHPAGGRPSRGCGRPARLRGRSQQRAVKLAHMSAIAMCQQALHPVRIVQQSQRACQFPVSLRCLSGGHKLLHEDPSAMLARYRANVHGCSPCAPRLASSAAVSRPMPLQEGSRQPCRQLIARAEAGHPRRCTRTKRRLHTQIGWATHARAQSRG